MTTATELSLFSGAGGGVLASKLLGHRIIGYVEYNDYCQRVLRQRIEDGYIDNAPIFTDVREFAQSGAAREYRGFADVVTAGFPCPSFSVAGARKGADDPRNMWPATIEVVRQVQPEVCFFENVPGLLSIGAGEMDDPTDGHVHGYFGDILRDISESGYSARWCVLGADDVNGKHRRKRLWIKCKRMANTNSKRETSRHGEV